MCDKAVDDSVAEWKLIQIGLLQVKSLKIFILLCMQMIVYSFLMKILMVSHSVLINVILSVNLNNINLDNTFDEDNPDTIILIRLLAWHGNLKSTKHRKKDK